MTERLHPTLALVAPPVRDRQSQCLPIAPASLARIALSLALVAGLAGCFHKPAPTLPQISLAPVDLEPPPEPQNPPLIEAPETAAEVPPAPPAQAQIITRRRPVAPPKDAAATPPVEIAGAADPAALAIGELSAGGDAAPQSQQEAKDLIAEIQKRLAALSTKTISQQRELVRKVRTFLKQAQQALESGDAEGARNLATKAKLLMDDVEKK